MLYSNDQPAPDHAHFAQQQDLGANPEVEDVTVGTPRLQSLVPTTGGPTMLAHPPGREGLPGSIATQAASVAKFRTLRVGCQNSNLGETQ